MKASCQDYSRQYVHSLGQIDSLENKMHQIEGIIQTN